MKTALPPALSLSWSEAPWDEAVCGFPVFQITEMRLGSGDPLPCFTAFEAARQARGVGLVSCRLPHERLAESMLLESRGFRVIEMVYRPRLALCVGRAPEVDLLQVREGSEADLPELLAIAGSAFRNERFRVDPRLAPEISDRRYQNWVRSSLGHARQRLRVLWDGPQRVAFFVIELLDDGCCYWHLNAVAPALHGRGYGRRAWLSMLADAAAMGAVAVQSSIVARNAPVLNLYASLGFRFDAPSTTLHWVAGDGQR